MKLALFCIYGRRPSVRNNVPFQKQPSVILLEAVTHLFSTALKTWAFQLFLLLYFSFASGGRVDTATETDGSDNYLRFVSCQRTADNVRKTKVELLFSLAFWSSKMGEWWVWAELVIQYIR